MSTSVITGGVALALLCGVISIYLFPNEARYTLSAIQQAGIRLAAIVIRHDFKSVAEIKDRYDFDDRRTKARILIVPGHESHFGGAEFAHLKERDITIELGQNLQTFFA